MEQCAQNCLHLTLRCDHRAPAAVRRAMSSLSGLGPVLGDALLVASELVTNALRHSDCVEHDILDVLVERSDDRLLITVRDPGGSEQEARIPPPADLPVGGMGLRIVDQLTTRWGSERRDGYIVWAELPLVAYAGL